MTKFSAELGVGGAAAASRAAGKRIREKSEPPPYDVVRNSTLLALPNERQRGRSRFDSFFASSRTARCVATS